MPAPVRLASSQMLVSSLDPKSQDQHSSPLATPLTSANCLQRDSPGNHTAMSHSIIPAELQLDKQELHDFVDETSKWPMEDKDDVTKYTTVFWYCCQPLIALGHMSLGECEELYLQGFHPDVRARFPPDFKQEMRDILQSPLPQAAHSSEILPAPSSPARTPPPPTPETPTSSTDFVASAPALSAAPAPAPSPVSDLVAPPPSLGRPKGPRHALATPTPPTSAVPAIRRSFSVSPLPPACNVSPPPPAPKHPTLVPPPPPVCKVSVTDCPAYFIFSFLFRLSRTVSVRDSGPLCPLLLTYRWTDLAFSRDFHTFPYASLSLHDLLWSSPAFW